jgi:hypothetical protein
LAHGALLHAGGDHDDTARAVLDRAAAAGADVEPEEAAA